MPTPTKPPKISIIIPVYNVEQYIQKCITSILEQTFNDYETIIVNDGTTDNSIKVAQKLINKDPRFTIINQENKGLGEARNTGIKVAKGEYVCFVDSDDYLNKDYLLLLYATITKNKADICTSDINIVHMGKPQAMKRNLGADNWQQAVKKILLCFDGGGMCHRLYKKHLFDNVKFKGFFCEDKLAMINILLVHKVGFIPFIDKPLYNYVSRENSITTTISKRHIDGLLNMLESTERLLTTYTSDKELISYYKYLYVAMISYIFAMICNNSIKSSNNNKEFNKNISYLTKKTNRNIFSWKTTVQMLLFDKYFVFIRERLIACKCIHIRLIGTIVYKLLQKYKLAPIIVEFIQKTKPVTIPKNIT